MKATKIRNVNGKVISREEMERLVHNLRTNIELAGYISNAKIVTSSSVKIGLNSSSFRVDTRRHGHNARIGRRCESPKGYKRTDVPNWDQRVEFNNIVNACFDALNLKANIVSGNYTVRSFDKGARDYWPEGGDRNNTLGYSANCYSDDIITEKEAIVQCDSVRRVAEHKAKQKELRALREKPKKIQKEISRLLK